MSATAASVTSLTATAKSGPHDVHGGGVGSGVGRGGGGVVTGHLQSLFSLISFSFSFGLTHLLLQLLLQFAEVEFFLSLTLSLAALAEWPLVA